MGGGPLRLIAFVDPELASSVGLLEAGLKTVAARPDVEMVAIVDTARRPSSPLRLPAALARWALYGAFNLTTGAQPEDRPLLTTCGSLARRWRVPVLAAGATGVNDPAFVERIRALAPDATLNLMAPQIFRAPLLAVCGTPINYHNGLLPRYRGVGATGWSIYEGAPQSGYTFHRMSQEVDGGPMLLWGAVPVGPKATATAVERAKTRLACAALHSCVDMLVSGAPEPVAQEGPASSFTRAALRAICTVEQPQELSLAELRLRLRAFEMLDLTLAGGQWRTTALRRVGPGARPGPLAFTTADGLRVEPSRIQHLPPGIHRLALALRGSASALRGSG